MPRRQILSDIERNNLFAVPEDKDELPEWQIDSRKLGDQYRRNGGQLGQEDTTCLDIHNILVFIKFVCITSAYSFFEL